MLRHPTYTRKRIEQLIDRIGERIYAQRLTVSDLVVAGPTDRISCAEARKLDGFRPAKIGDQFGPAWATFWFRGKAQVPAEWKGSRVDLLWDSQSEATLWIDGRTIQGLNMTQGDRPDAILLDEAAGGDAIAFEIEMACNNKFGVSQPNAVAPSTGGGISPFHLRRCEIARFDPQAWELYFDAFVLAALEQDLARQGATSDLSWQGLLLSELNRFANALDLDDRGTWPAAQAILRKLYDYRNGTRVFELSAIGHAHIDTAWLWPLAETHRKCERSFTTATAYMRDYPEYRFSCSQAYQYEVMQQRNPDLYQRIVERVRTGQWVPVGGTWIEPDCNIPSGEALCRQFLFGQRFFEKAFGKRCREFWNPDVFGYNGQLPQIMRLSGVERFLTQKLSWNRFNKPHHHTFTWRGIDGSEVFTHFPPADTYNALTNVGKEIEDLRHNVANYRDHDRSHEGFLLFGFGDGGGGPTKRMLEVLRRTADLQGMPRVAQRSSEEFFDRLEHDCTDRPVVVGELYFEYHRGTYTSQAATKRNNRLCEQLLHDLELVRLLGERQGGPAYPRQALDELWKLVLLNQFHDILPGSSIKPVYEDAARQYAHVLTEGNRLLTEAAGQGQDLFNTLGVSRREVVQAGGRLTCVEAEPLAVAREGATPDSVSLRQDKDRYILANEYLRAVFTIHGRLISLVNLADGREAIDGEANVFELYDDYPTQYDAWDVDPHHLETRQLCDGAHAHEIVGQQPLRAEIAFDYRLGKDSKLRQVVRLDAGSRRLEVHCNADWQECQRMLKVAFPATVRAMNATYEMQFGDVERPTHYNTPYDLARYEVPMHRWFDLSEHGFGLAILNDCKYGGSVFGHVMRLSLLRAPLVPDPTCDRGEHRFAFALMPHAGGWREADVVAEALRFNYPLREVEAGRLPAGPFARVDSPNLVLDTIKKAEDSGDVVLRLYECHGARGQATIELADEVVRAVYCNVLEEKVGQPSVEGRRVHIQYRPRQVIGLKLSLR